MEQEGRPAVLTVDSVGRVQSGLILGGIADEPLGAGEGDTGWHEAAALVVDDDLPAVVLPHGHTRVLRPQVDADRRPLAFGGRHLHRKDKYYLKLRRLIYMTATTASCQYIGEMATWCSSRYNWGWLTD